eukprot:Gb_23065 [translate_table: standard]
MWEHGRRLLPPPVAPSHTCEPHEHMYESDFLGREDEEVEAREFFRKSMFLDFLHGIERNFLGIGARDSWERLSCMGEFASCEEEIEIFIVKKLAWREFLHLCGHFCKNESSTCIWRELLVDIRLYLRRKMEP